MSSPINADRSTDCAVSDFTKGPSRNFSRCALLPLPRIATQLRCSLVRSQEELGGSLRRTSRMSQLDEQVNLRGTPFDRCRRDGKPKFGVTSFGGGPDRTRR